MTSDQYIPPTLGPAPTGAFVLKKHASYRYVPQPDITIYELVQIMPFLVGALLTQEAWEKLGSANRHLPINGD